VFARTFRIAVVSCSIFRLAQIRIDFLLYSSSGPRSLSVYCSLALGVLCRSYILHALGLFCCLLLRWLNTWVPAYVYAWSCLGRWILCKRLYVDVLDECIYFMIIMEHIGTSKVKKKLITGLLIVV
jgi:hypothetical protein